MTRYNQTVKWEKGNWQVVRDCCTSGLCVGCHQRPANQPRPARMVHADGYSQAYAEYVAAHWSAYNAVAEPMPEVKS